MDFRPFKIGKYLLLERLATGGMAEVYRAKASGAGGFEKQLAIKRILPTYSANEEFRRMFEYEARLSSMLTHANIVQVYDFVKSGETYLLAMEYVDGKNLRQFVNKARKLGVKIPLPFSVYLMNEVCKGLEYAHDKKDDLTGKPLNIIHRDMSPQNIMLSYDGAVKIVDFGIAKAKDRVDETRSGVIKGKFGYMSPEQANGQPIDHRSDIFSTTIILWEMLTGRRLFSAENDMATLKLIQECIIPTPTRINPKIPAELEKIVLKGLTKDLNLRYQSAGELHRRLQAFLNKHFPSFTQKDAAEILQQCFREDIAKEKKRFEQIYRQSIPFSQGAPQPRAEEDELEEILDGDVTKSEHGEKTPVTFVDEQISLSNQDSLNPPDTHAPTQIADTGSGTLEDTQIDSLIIEDESVSTLGRTPRTGTSTQPRTEVRNPPAKAPLSRDKTGESLPGDSLFDLPEDSNPLGSAPGLYPEEPSQTRSPVGSLTDNTQPEPDTPPPPSFNSGDIVLNNEAVSGSRRRERSISSLTEMTNMSTGGGSEQPISLVSINQEPNTGTPDPQASRRSPTAPRTFIPTTDYVPRKKKSRFLSFLFALTIVTGTFYLYQVYLEGGLPALIERVAGRLGRESADQRVPAGDGIEDAVSSEEFGSKAVGDCTIRLITDPAGAAVYVNGERRGVTNTAVSGECGSQLAVAVELMGYERVEQTLNFSESLSDISLTLTPIPMGVLRLTLTRNADLYIEGKLVRRGRANETVELPVRANTKQEIRFVNQVMGIDTVRAYEVAEDSVFREVVPLGTTN